MRRRGSAPGEWPTWALLALILTLWALLTIWAGSIGIAVACAALVPVLVLHSSLQHEALHVLEPRWPRTTRIAVFAALGLFIPYIRFRDTHLAHHENENITDPFDDPESYYIEPSVWAGLGWPMKALLAVNNTLLGRLILGPLIGQIFLIHQDIRAHRAGDRTIAPAWGWHALGVALVLGWLWAFGTMPLWAYVLSAYGALSVLKIRTFLEHQADEIAGHRSVIIERGGILGFLFLNNNLHAAHHAHPNVPWYALGRLYRRQRHKFLSGNGGYSYRSYGEVMRLFLLRAKEPVSHPIWNFGNRSRR